MIDSLCAENLRELLENATPGPWELWDSCSWRRFGSVSGRLICEPYNQSTDGHPDLHFKNGGQYGADAKLMALAWSMARALLEQSIQIAQLKQLNLDSEYARYRVTERAQSAEAKIEALKRGKA